MSEPKEAVEEAASQSKELGSRARRKPYETPVLVEWGSIHELTAGPAGSTEDDDFSGTSGV